MNGEVPLFFSAFKLTPLQFHHVSVPCCVADFGRYLPWEIGNIVIHVFLSMYFRSNSFICSLYCLLICFHNFCFERPTRPRMILRKWTQGLKQIRPVK